MRSRFHGGVGEALDRELLGLDLHMRRGTLPPGLDLERAQLLLERAREHERHGRDEISNGHSLQHGGGLMREMAHGRHPAMVWEQGRRMVSDGLSEEMDARRRVRYLEGAVGKLHSTRAKEQAVPTKAPEAGE